MLKVHIKHKTGGEKMDEIMILVNGIGMSAAEITQLLSEIGNGNMQDGIRNIYYDTLETGVGIGYKNRMLDEVMETSANNTRQKFIIGGVCLLVGAGLTIGGISLTKKIRNQKHRKNTSSNKLVDDISSEKQEEEYNP